jgi:uncharacterized membrane protein YeaQ/YmgE (transglycosylase-associated protein family)
MLALVTNNGQQCWSGEDGGWIGQAACADDGPEVAIWGRSNRHMRALLVAVAVIAAICGFIASAVARRNKRRARGFFLLGFFCGLMAGAILRGRRCGTGHFAARAKPFAASHVRLGLWPSPWHRQVSQRLRLRLAGLLMGSAPMLRFGAAPPPARGGCCPARDSWRLGTR